jgi:hypothetical protein
MDEKDQQQADFDDRNKRIAFEDERVFVEHETANFYGGNFWCTYFNPYVYASMRYIDTTLHIQG